MEEPTDIYGVFADELGKEDKEDEVDKAVEEIIEKKPIDNNVKGDPRGVILIFQLDKNNFFFILRSDNSDITNCI